MTTPTEHNSRSYEAFLRGPVATMAFAFGTVEAYRSSVWHAPLLALFPEPSDSFTDGFGIVTGGGFTVEIADEDGDADWLLLWEDGTRVLWEDGTRIILEY